ncbi:DUF4878 domain-containing protein [Peribacillus frigoritolerans]|uniref:Rv0361 family membrane protein n=1 Tax=Peribacillus frigoritolerans TaxID=450367 RepID=UPI0021CE6F88|nr:DUF4878 domain-containing protein [Peribacillus frigoritolerans]MCU6603826.1 DUF4878 domain-containing protein [Peribacillus frigoritolerans]
MIQLIQNKKIIGAIIAIIVLSLSSWFMVVSSKENDYTPEQAIERYYKAAQNGDIDEAKKYCATEVLDYYERGNAVFTGTISAAIQDEGSKYEKVQPEKTKITGQFATVSVNLTHQGGDYKTTEDYHLIKEEDGWKLTFQ